MRSDGTTRQWDEDGEARNVTGSHTGDYAGLNVANAQPGKLYQWVHNTPTDLMRERGKGGVVVDGSSEASSAVAAGLLSDGESDVPTPLDTTALYGDVVLHEYPEEKIAARRERNADRAVKQIENADSAFLEGAGADELESAGGQQTRFLRREHATHLEGDGQIIKRFKSDSDAGIV